MRPGVFNWNNNHIQPISVFWRSLVYLRTSIDEHECMTQISFKQNHTLCPKKTDSEGKTSGNERTTDKQSVIHKPVHTRRIRDTKKILQRFLHPKAQKCCTSFLTRQAMASTRENKMARRAVIDFFALKQTKNAISLVLCTPNDKFAIVYCTKNAKQHWLHLARQRLYKVLVRTSDAKTVSIFKSEQKHETTNGTFHNAAHLAVL